MVTLSKGMPQEKLLKWTSMDVQEVIDSDIRLDAESFGIEGRQARDMIAECKWLKCHPLFRP